MGAGSLWMLRDAPPGVFVIDLTRMPSHGRWMGGMLRGSKATRMIPLVVVGGDPEKVRLVRRYLPDAVFTSFGGLAAALKTSHRRNSQ
jgi:hypothetical protein